MGASDVSFSVATAVSASSGALVQIDAEVMIIQSNLTNSTTVPVTRASHGSTAVAHTAETGVYLLEEKIFIMPFAQDFFGSPASGSYAFPITIPDVRIAAAELFMTNSKGNSSVAAESFTDTTDLGFERFWEGSSLFKSRVRWRFRPTRRPRWWWRTHVRCGTFSLSCRTRLPERR